MISSEIYYNQLQQKYSRKITLGLSRVQKALKLLKEPHLKLNQPCNILGSDGKFSCLTSIKYFIEANGQTTSTFISPHLFDLRTRIWLKNRFISLKEIKKYEKQISKLKVRLSLFEVLTLIYILAAAKEKCSYNILESGLLFKKDSSNIFKKPLLQACTNINKQHLEWIHPKTINEICRQKVGYLSNESNIYIGKQNPKTLKIIKGILKKNKSRITYPSKWRIIKKGQKIYYKDYKHKISIRSNFIHSKGLIDNLGLAIKIALDLKIDDIGRMTRQEIIYAILKSQFESKGEIYAESVLEILNEGYGFLRSPKYSYLPGPDDIYVSKSQVRSFILKSGDTVGGYVRLPREGEKNLALLKIESVNSKDISDS